MPVNVIDSFGQRQEPLPLLILDDFAIFIIVFYRFCLLIDVFSPFSDQFLVFPDDINTDRAITKEIVVI